MNPIKIIFFDIDGTLIDMNTKQISTKMLEALKQLKENNIKICIATGRTPLALPHFEGIEFDAYLTFNGSYCFDKSHTIFSNPIHTTDVHTFIQNATDIHRPLALATKDNLIANGKDDDLVEYFSFAKLEVNVSDEFDKIANDEIYQIMLGCCENDYPALMQNIQHSKITAWWDRAIDIIPADGGKGTGIEKMLEYYHLDKSEAMAFGDGNNDIEMLQTVGHGIAMANASEELKSVADDICGHVAEDGIYYYCKKLQLI